MERKIQINFVKQWFLALSSLITQKHKAEPNVWASHRFCCCFFFCSSNVQQIHCWLDLTFKQTSTTRQKLLLLFERTWNSSVVKHKVNAVGDPDFETAPILLFAIRQRIQNFKLAHSSLFAYYEFGTLDPFLHYLTNSQQMRFCI